MTASSIVGVLKERAASTGRDQIAIGFYENGGWTAWSWAEFWGAACSAAAGLAAAGIRPTDRVMLVVPEMRPAVTALFGLWVLGGVPVPVGIPFVLGEKVTFVDRLADTARQVGAASLLLPEELARRHPADSKDEIRRLVIDEVLGSSADASRSDLAQWAGATPRLAYIQLTSGSTGRPRAIEVPHDRLLRHLTAMSAALPVRPDSIGLSWLPLHHDMGLVGGLLIPFHNGFPIYLIGTTDFRNRPWIWLEAMAQLRATICAAPPSAYAVCTKLAARARRKCLDLGAWECALVGAEPISAGTLRRFAAAFASCGFRADALFPVYGLAEATLAVTCPRIQKPPRIDRVDRASVEKYDFAIPSDDADTLEFVSVGAPLPGTEVRIADRNGGPLPERRIGEILVRSATIMEGYVGEQDGTAPIRDGWLQTGDLGYFVEGDLFITGRIKDLIIHGGQNLIPAVLEEIVAAVDGVRAGGAAAIGVRSAELGTEEVCVVAETPLAPAEYPELATRIREALSGYGVALDRVLLIPPRALPRTTSGKPRRQPLARALASGCPTDVTALGSEQ